MSNLFDALRFYDSIEAKRDKTVGTDSPSVKRRMDHVHANLLIVGDTCNDIDSTTSGVWRIKALYKVGTEILCQYPLGISDYGFVWDDRMSLFDFTGVVPAEDFPVDLSVYELNANKDTDSTMAANSDVKYPSQKAVKSHVASAISGIDLSTKANVSGQVFSGAISATNLSGTNTGDETQATIKTKLGSATTSVDGYLTSSDYNIFKNKLGMDDVCCNIFQYEEFGMSSTYYTGTSSWAGAAVNSGYGGSTTEFFDVSGCVEMDTGTSANGGWNLSNWPVVFNLGILTHESRVKIETLDTVNNTIYFHAGIFQAGAYALGNGVAFLYSPSAIGGANQGNWHAVSALANTETVTNTGVPVVAGTWYKLRIVVESNTSAKYYINGTLVATNTTNIPTNNQAIKTAFRIRQAGSSTSNRRAFLDYCALNYALTTSR